MLARHSGPIRNVPKRNKTQRAVLYPSQNLCCFLTSDSKEVKHIHCLQEETCLTLAITNKIGCRSQITSKTCDTTKEIQSVNFFKWSFLFVNVNLIKGRRNSRIKYQCPSQKRLDGVTEVTHAWSRCTRHPNLKLPQRLQSSVLPVPFQLTGPKERAGTGSSGD